MEFWERFLICNETVGFPGEKRCARW